MKKSILFILIIACICVFAFGCKTNDTPAPEENKISFSQTMFYHGECGDYTVKLTGGNGEKLFVADGKVGDSGSFVKLTVTPLSHDLTENETKYIIIGSLGQTQGTLSKDAFGAYFSAEPLLDSIGVPQSITLCVNDTQKEIPLTNLLDGKINCAEALVYAKEALKEKLSKDDKEREIYIRLINNSTDKNSPYYWYVAFISNPSDYYSALVDPTDGKILSVNP